MIYAAMQLIDKCLRTGLLVELFIGQRIAYNSISWPAVGSVLEKWGVAPTMMSVIFFL